MEFTLTTRHFQPTEALKNRIEKRMGKLDRFNSLIQHVEVILDLDGNMRKAEIVLKTKKNVITAKAIHHDSYAAFDQAYKKLKSRLVKLDDRIREHNGGQ